MVTSERGQRGQVTKAADRSLVGDVVRGGVNGALATVGMSAFLLGAQQLGLLGKQPPRIIVESLAPEATEEETRPTSIVAHFGYGAAAGAAYQLLARAVRPTATSGAAYGLAVWAASYEGWLPWLGILPPAHRDRPGRRWTMVAAHLVYGATLGALTRK